MAGHSQFKNIMFRKGKQDKERSKLFSKLAREITVASKAGLPDPNHNPRLRTAIIAAKAQSMPKDNIERAIKKGQGGDAENYDEVRYEGRGPGGVALIVEALTDNKNRTAAEVRLIFSKHDGNLAGSGAAAHLFERQGIVLVPADGVDEDELTLAAADGGAEYVALDGSSFEITSTPESLSAVREAVEGAGFPVESVEVARVPTTTVTIEDEAAARKILRLMDALEENDDVQDVFANFDIPEAVLETVAS